MARRLLLCLFVATFMICLPVVDGHGAVTIPPPRNAIDSVEMPWAGTVPAKLGRDGMDPRPWCPFPSAAAAKSDPGRNLTGSNGQACMWFSNGCAIGCSSCDGDTRGPIPLFGGNPLRPVPNHIDESTGRLVQKLPICAGSGGDDDASTVVATICDPLLRTVNTAAKCGAWDDFYYYTPWRAPGSAPVIDSCGSAGGRLKGQGGGYFGATYVNTTNAKVGDHGSEIAATKPGPTATWRAGTTVEVAWTMMANHGGGYAYRLCPLGTRLDEACFQRQVIAVLN